MGKELYIQKRDAFIGLSHLYAKHVESWNKMDRNARKVGKGTSSVYRHSKSKGKSISGGQRFRYNVFAVPSLISIFQHMFAQESSKSRSVTAETSTRAGFLHEGLLIQEAQ